MGPRAYVLRIGVRVRRNCGKKYKSHPDPKNSEDGWLCLWLSLFSREAEEYDVLLAKIFIIAMLYYLTFIQF